MKDSSLKDAARRKALFSPARARKDTGNEPSPVVSMIVREHRLKEQLQQTKYDYDTLVDDVRHRVQLLREHIETRRQSLRAADACDDESRRAVQAESEFDWLETDDPRQALNQLLRLVEKHHQEVDLRLSAQDDALHAATVCQQSLTAKLRTSQRDLERVTAARDRYEHQLTERQGECEQLSQDLASIEEQLAATVGQRDDLTRRLNDLRQENEANVQRLHAELTLRKSAEAKIVDLEASAAELQEENRSAGEALARTERELAETSTQLQDDLQRERAGRAQLETETNKLRERLAGTREELAAEQARVQATREDVSRLLAAHKELKAENRSLQQEAERNEQALSDALVEVRHRLSQMTAQHDGRRRELEALRQQRDQERSQHRAAQEDWQATLRKVRQEVQRSCEKAQRQQRQASEALQALHEQHADLAGRCEKLEQNNDELRAERTHLKLCVATAETPTVRRRLVTNDGRQHRIDGAEAGQPPHLQLRFADLRERESQEHGARER